MVAILFLGLFLFTGSSAYQLKSEVVALNVTSNGTTLELYPSLVQVDFMNIWGWVSWTHSCSASILNLRHVLTAASCFSGPDYPSPQSRRIRAGANMRNVGGTIIYVERAIIHQSNATNSSIANADIAVVRLRSPFIYSNVIRPTAIVAGGTIIPSGLPLNQVGWGRTNTTVSLTSAVVITFSRSQNITTNATANILTANAGVDARFNADVGGPWLYRGVTVGVISGGNLLGNATWREIVATSVSAYTDWIVRVVV